MRIILRLQAGTARRTPTRPDWFCSASSDPSVQCLVSKNTRLVDRPLREWRRVDERVLMLSFCKRVPGLTASDRCQRYQRHDPSRQGADARTESESS